LEIINERSGEVILDLQADDIEVRIEGRGDVILEGSAESVELDGMSGGDLMAYELVVDDAKINLYASGDARIYALDLVIANIYDSGSIYYRGNPQIFSQISGTGSLINAN